MRRSTSMLERGVTRIDGRTELTTSRRGLQPVPFVHQQQQARVTRSRWRVKRLPWLTFSPFRSRVRIRLPRTRCATPSVPRLASSARRRPSNHPVVRASLTHEVCGHDVVHADPELVPGNWISAVRSMLSRTFVPRKKLDAATLNALIWSHWMDEAVADVYGILNMGPIFPINVAAFIERCARK